MFVIILSFVCGLASLPFDAVIFAFVFVCVSVRVLIFLVSPVYAVLVTYALYVCVLAFIAV